jgi:hypothetical protein
VHLVTKSNKNLLQRSSSYTCQCYELVRGIHRSGRGVTLFPFARWLLLQLWRAAGGEGTDSTRVCFFVTRIAKKYITQTFPDSTGR